jgi:hypothetical protein
VGSGRCPSQPPSVRFSKKLLFKKVYDKMGRAQELKRRHLDDGDLYIGHAWNEIETDDGGRYYVDVFNNIIFWCP